MRGLLRPPSRYRDELLSNFYAMGRRSIARGAKEGPFAFAIPPDQHDPAAANKLVNLLAEGGVEVQQASEPFKVGDTVYPVGTAFVLMAQPFRAYAKSLLEEQKYPVRKLAGSPTPERPYDVAGWTLPLPDGRARRARSRAAFEAPLMSRIDRVTTMPAWPLGYPKPDYYLVDARGSGRSRRGQPPARRRTAASTGRAGW